MSKGLTVTYFDYSTVSKGKAEILKKCAEKIHKSREQTAKAMLSMGRELKIARDAVQGDGSFKRWVEDEFGYSRATAYRAIRAYETFQASRVAGRFEVNAMYLLSEPRHEMARKAALKLLESKPTAMITGTLAEVLIEKAAEEKRKRERNPRSEDYKTRHSDSLFDPDEECPTCSGKWFRNTDEGAVCDYCNHPADEPAGDPIDVDDEPEPGDDELKEMSAEQEKEYKKARRAYGQLVRYFEGLGVKEAQSHIKKIGKLLG